MTTVNEVAAPAGTAAPTVDREIVPRPFADRSRARAIAMHHLLRRRRRWSAELDRLTGSGRAA